MQCQWKDKFLNITGQEFEHLAMDIFRFQYEQNNVYREYVNAVFGDAENIKTLAQVPFLPIRFFKSREVKTTAFETKTIFESSGTTGSINSRHFIKDTGLYESSFTRCFEAFYGPVNDWCIIGLLPSYLERQNSSLVYMVNKLIGLSGHPSSGFYLDELDQLLDVLEDLASRNQKTLLIGVTFALLDFTETHAAKFKPGLFKNITVMETGGMKGRRQEMIRQQVHDILKSAFNLPVIQSEYGMTEILSQAYSQGDGIFRCPPWLKIMIRDEEDPLSILEQWPGSARPLSGAINIIDLANIFSCSFIATDDAGKLFPDGSFEVLGRIDNSDLRGCSLMTV